MPKVTLIFKADLIQNDNLLLIGKEVKELVAEAASTPDNLLSADDVDWIPQPLHESALAAPVSIEIETIGFPARKEKLQDKELLLRLKQQILDLHDFPKAPKIDPDAPLIWIKFVDPAGPHA